ncbi:hypothetical protein [Streptomyces sp. NPDC050504]|uniref:hypothetical protein n=1 Tax=Streptomyces sp. NPDC050504 TaxID=3365618 RepID=UPI0037B32A8C
MIYNFLTVRRPAPDEMAAALADLTGVTAAEVDVADEDAEQDDRDWAAPVLCGYRPVTGDVALSWDVYVSDAVSDPPNEARAALRLAARTGTTVLYPGQEPAPSAYWAATPEGTVARVRVEEADDGSGGRPVLTVEASDAPLAQLPGARVGPLPEFHRAEPLATPVTDAFAAATDPEGTAPAPSPENRAREELLLWERLVSRTASGWAPTGRYPQELYLADLRTRDQLAERLATAPDGFRERLAGAVDGLDAVFRAHTEDDGGALTGRLTGSGRAAADRGWWWRRRPAALPWG